MRNIEEIAWDLCELYYKTKPPINKNTLFLFLSIFGFIIHFLFYL